MKTEHKVAVHAVRWALEYYAGIKLDADQEEELVGIIQRTYTDEVIQATEKKSEALKSGRTEEARDHTAGIYPGGCVSISSSGEEKP